MKKHGSTILLFLILFIGLSLLLYASLFGGLSQLTQGDRVIFTDMDGIVTVYEVVAQDVLSPYAVEEMVAGDFDLMLFTCTYGGQSRITVYCDRVS